MSRSFEMLASVLGLSGGELVLLAVVALVLFGANKIPTFLKGMGLGIREFQKASDDVGRELGESIGADYGKPVADALTHSNQTCEFQDPPALRLRKARRQMKDQTLLWLAQGFGWGRIPFAPGTFGSAIGLAWFALLLAFGNFYLYLIGMVAGAGLSVWLCGEGERILGKKDPGSVVMDEIIAIPICFLAWVAILYFRGGALPEPAYFFGSHLPLTVGVFLAFRFFDILKPWPVCQSQSLPGGWGVTVDDVLAAVYVNAVVALAQTFWPHLL